MSRGPTRITDLAKDASPEDAFLRSLIRRQPEDLPSDAKMQELATRLGPIAGSSTKSAPLVSGWRWLFVVAASGALAALPIVVRTQAHTAGEPSSSPAPVVSVIPAPVVTSAPATPSAETAVNAVPSMFVDSLPTANTERVRPTATPTCTNEIELVDRADATLRAGDAKRALELTREHGARCPNGSFVQERERVAIEALALLGEGEMMRTRAKAFELRFPSSPHVRRIRNLASSNPE
ncbi:MAG: hypothetical protein BGO98_02475 [Myxococcales bacterium 68-20]|nr:MAG: hypothetical protein BGO98_02475 [Myxococcales bacterium 68-20]